MILGIGCGKAETFELVRRMTEEVYRETGAAGLKEYFEQKIQESRDRSAQAEAPAAGAAET